MADSTSKNKNEINIPESGIYVRGVVVSKSCRLINKKDGSGRLVLIKHELATQPGMAVWEEFFDPARNPGIKIEGEQVSTWPQCEEFQPVTLRAERFRIVNETLHVSNAEVIS